MFKKKKKKDDLPELQLMVLREMRRDEGPEDEDEDEDEDDEDNDSEPKKRKPKAGRAKITGKAGY